ncbi:MAG: hypothetical protein AAF790_08740, partial [Planctomycetota bacterium]
TAPRRLIFHSGILDMQGKSWRESQSGDDSKTGIPVEGYADNPPPVFPIVEIDKQMWLPADAAMGRGATPAVEIEFEVFGAELLDAVPPHPWTVAVHQWHGHGRTAGAIVRPPHSSGDYVLLRARLLSGRVIDLSAGNKELFPLDLTPHPETTPQPAAADASNAASTARASALSRTASGSHPGSRDDRSDHNPDEHRGDDQRGDERRSRSASLVSWGVGSLLVGIAGVVGVRRLRIRSSSHA